MNIFEIIPPNLFNPLSGKNKAIVFDCLARIYDLCSFEQSVSIEKEVVLEDLKNYFEDHSVFEEDGLDKNVNANPQARASALIRKLKETGWIDEEFVGSVLKLSIPNVSQMVLECMLDIIRDEETDYKASIHNIYSIIINSENFKEPYSLVLKNIDNLMKGLLKNLKKLNTNIKKYIEKIVMQKKPREVIECLENFYDEVISREFKRVKSDANISAYRVRILDKIDSIKEDELTYNLAIRDCMLKENVTEPNEAKVFIDNLIYQIKNVFNSYQKIMESVDDRYKKFFCSTKERAEFLMANDNNLKGKLELTLQYMSDIFNIRNDNLDEHDEIISNIIKIYPQFFVGSDSLYVQPIRSKTNIISDISDTFELSNDEKSRLIESELERLRKAFNQKNINKFIVEILEIGGSLMASSLQYLNARDDIRTMFIYLYANQSGSNYGIKPLSKIVRCGNIEFKDFEIVRIK